MTTSISTNGNGVPASTLPPQPTPEPAKVDMAREYAAGGRDSWADRYARALPKHIDDVTGALGIDVYDRMQRDPAVSSALDVIKVSILAHGYQVVAATLPEDAPQADRDRAADIAAFCTHALDCLSLPFEDVLDDLLGALAEGNRIAEKTWQSTTYEGASRLGLASIKVKPRQSVAFAVDAYMNVLGILARVPGLPFPVQSGAFPIDAANPPANLLPRDKFVVFSYRPKDSDPRGTSILRPAYDPWWIKQQATGEFLKWLAQFATPSIAGFTPETASGYSLPDVTTGLTPVQALYQMLLDFQNGSAIALPGGSKLQTIFTAGGEQGFKYVLAYCDAQITVAILLQLLATSTADHQTQAATTEHGNVLDDVISRIKGSLEAVVVRDILRPLVLVNWGEQAMRLCPGFSLGAVEQQDLTPLMTAIANLKRSGYLDPSQLAACDVLLQLPVRQPMEAETPPPPAPIGAEQPDDNPPADDEDEMNEDMQGEQEGDNE
jgi:hypothetical protein